jgi:hypothetical protein
MSFWLYECLFYLFEIEFCRAQQAMKMESEDSDVADSSQAQPVELTTTPQEHRIEFSNSSEPLQLPPNPHVCISNCLFIYFNLFLRKSLIMYSYIEECYVFPGLPD